MAKDKSGGKVSAGIHSNVSRKVVNALRADYMASADRIMNQLKAYRQGKRVMLTMDNPNKEAKNKAFVRVPANTVWRDYR